MHYINYQAERSATYNYVDDIQRHC